MFITFEGIEGSGKSTQARLLVEYLRGKGLNVILTREPGGVELSERIRSILIETGLNISSRAELLLFLASRAQHTDELIRPSLRKGHIVVCDRYIDASVAYQGYGRGLSIEMIKRLNDWATGGIRPNLTVLLDLSPEEGLKRVRASKKMDRIEGENLEFHRRVREGYLEIARSDPDRFLVLDATRSMEEIQRFIREAVEACLRTS
ncbi:MAG: dTMP kinase [Candidatus Thorarchaeota archaeon]|nr:MAG: dTMP kinase [Candidatus Thorarchaeota archaeon]